MEARGYDPMNIRGHFAEIANLKRQDALKKVERRKKKWKERPIFFVKTARTCFSKYREINSETLEASTQRFGTERTLSKKFVHNILQTPEKI